MKQPWKCDVCGKSGSVEYSKAQLWFHIVSEIGRDHKLVSPDCNGNAQKVFHGKKLVDKNGVAVIVA
jgi:hypothetical protein